MTHQDILYKELAAQFNLPVAEIERICRYQFKYLRQQIEGDNYKAVRLPFWAVYKPIPKRVERYLTKHSKPAPDADTN